MNRTVAFTVVLLALTSSANAGGWKLYYTLKSGANGVQGGYSSQDACMKAGSKTASFASKIESFYCSQK